MQLKFLDRLTRKSLTENVTFRHREKEPCGFRVKGKAEGQRKSTAGRRKIKAKTLKQKHFSQWSRSSKEGPINGAEEKEKKLELRPGVTGTRRKGLVLNFMCQLNQATGCPDTGQTLF